MAPPISIHTRRSDPDDGSWRSFASDEDFILESWSQGFMVGALLIMACITIANMRRGVLLHKLILVEQLAALSHGTFCFMSFNGYGWYLSSTAALLYCSWIVHNVVAWMKIRPFFIDSRSMFKPSTGKWVRRIYLGTLVCSVPPIILQIYDNFRFFNNISDFYTTVRPYEPLMSINPFWKLSLVFKCLTDTIMLDDFKTELKRLGIKRMRQDEMRRQSFALVADNLDSKTDDGHMEFTDALNTSPTQFQTMQTFDDSPSRGSTGRLRQDSVGEPRKQSKEYLGKAGKKISRLPGLKEFSFKPAKGRSRIDDEEKPNENEHPPPAPERLSQMRQSLGVLDYHAR
ncbi:hypothetical protein H2202_004126 [Exophiala xenobiotica]|nr:hypothetical protein H2202_004126 [Exophiala xenobiotica]